MIISTRVYKNLIVSLLFVQFFLLHAHGGEVILADGSYACGRSSTSSATQNVCNRSLIYDKKGGTERSYADILYIPYKQADSANNYHADGELFIFEESISVTLNLKFTGTNTTQKYYFIAVRDSDNIYKVANVNIARAVQLDQTLTFTLSNLRLTDIGDSSSKLTYTSTSGSTVIYIFMAPYDFNSSEIDITDEEYSGGYFVKLNFSSLYDDTNSPQLTSASRGDKVLKLSYGIGSVNSSIYSRDNTNFLYALTYSFSDVNALPGNYQPYGTVKLAGATIQAQNGEQIGGAKIKNLTNGTTYYSAIALMNKYKFISLSSEFLQGTPQQIEVFLDGKSCYLISAGFQTDHKVLEYFRMIRDNYLLHNSLGRSFIHWYYSWSPPMATYIINHPWSAAVTRLMAYTLYFFMNYFSIVLLSLLSAGFLLFSFRIRKLSQKN